MHHSGKAIKAYIAQQNTLGQKAIEADFEVFFSQADKEKQAVWKEEACIAVNEVSSRSLWYSEQVSDLACSDRHVIETARSSGQIQRCRGRRPGAPA